MGKTSIRLKQRLRRKVAIRKRVSGTEQRPRLTVFKSGKHIYAQVIDDTRGVTLSAASTLSGAVRDGLGELKPCDRARKVGEHLASVCKAKGIESVVMDRNGFKYHGRVKALAEGARSGGLKF